MHQSQYSFQKSATVFIDFAKAFYTADHSIL